MVTVLITVTSFSQYQYDVRTELQYVNKDVLVQIDELFFTYNKELKDNSIIFSSNMNFTEENLGSLLETQLNIPVNLIIKNKDSLPNFEKVGGVNCELAEQLCSNASFTGTNSGFGIQELNSTNAGCLLGNEHQSSWYYVNIQTGGTLNINIVPNSPTDYDFAIWGPFTSATANVNCPPINLPLRCDFAATTAGTGLSSTPGIGYQTSINALSNQIYILLIDNFSSTNIGYSVNFNTSTAILGCTPVILPVTLKNFSGSQINNNNVLDIEFESEINTFQLIIQRSIDGLNYEQIGIINMLNTSSIPTRYKFIDNLFINEINYYKIKQIDMNGDINNIDKVVVIENKNKKVINQFNILGQPVTNDYKGIIIVVYDDLSIEKIVR